MLLAFEARLHGLGILFFLILPDSDPVARQTSGATRRDERRVPLGIQAARDNVGFVARTHSLHLNRPPVTGRLGEGERLFPNRWLLRESGPGHRWRDLRG